MSNWKDNVHFILVEPREAGNIGASARAIKNMGFSKLCLVNPPSLTHPDAETFAHNAMDILRSARVFDSLSSAISDMQYVVGTSRRKGRRRGVFLDVHEAVRELVKIAMNNKVAILFGREDRGLYNHEVEECAFLITIPASIDHPSLNLSQAVLIVAYELLRAGMILLNDSSVERPRTHRYVTHEELDKLHTRLIASFEKIGYITDENPVRQTKIIQNLKHFLGRVGLTDWEYNMLHAICERIEKITAEKN